VGVFAAPADPGRDDAQIANTINDVLKSQGVGVIIKATHHYMTTRGVHKPGMEPVTRMSGFGCEVDIQQNRCSRQVSFVRIWKLEVAPDYHRVSGVVNRRRHRPLRAILPDPPGSAGAIAGQRERVATITRRAVVDSGCAAFTSRGGIHRGSHRN
jgi:hypothetical protein